VERRERWSISTAPTAGRPGIRAQEEPMLLVGIDWAEEEHAACLLEEGGRVVQRLRVAHTAAGLKRLHGAIAGAEPDPAAVLVALERPDGLLVTSLLGAGYTVYALNPKSVERYRDRARTGGGKSDPADAELLARVLLTDRDRHRPLLPSSERAQEVRAVARDDERAARDQRRLLNRLRLDLLDVFPQALEAFPALDAPTALAFLAHWPSVAAATPVAAADLEAFFRQQRHGWPARAAAQVRAALEAEALAAPAHLVRAKAGTVRLLAEQLLLLHRQRAAWEARLRELLGPEGHPDGEVLLSLPGLDARLAARVLGEVGDRRERFPTPAGLQCYAGTAPVTRASGKARVVSSRLACNRVLRQACMQWAFCSLARSGWARELYVRHRAAGKTHFKALRVLAIRWLEVLHHLLLTGEAYDAAVHQANRTKAPRLVA
jgi:transposase